MVPDLETFERIVRSASRFTQASSTPSSTVHPFDSRNIHSDLPSEIRRLFDNGHYPQATFEAFKFVDEEVQRLSADSDFGKSLMMRVFGGTPPKLAFNLGSNPTELSEQEGYKFMFAGAMAGIRNPRGHKTGVADDPDTCLDHLTFASMLLRKLEDAGLR